MDEKSKRAMGMIKAVYEEGVATINGRDYVFTAIPHRKRLKVFAFFTEHQESVQNNNWSFLGLPEWDAVQKLICSAVTFENSALTKKPTHWDDYPEDFLMFVSTALGVFSYPFLRGAQ